MSGFRAPRDEMAKQVSPKGEDTGIAVPQVGKVQLYCKLPTPLLEIVRRPTKVGVGALDTTSLSGH